MPAFEGATHSTLNQCIFNDTNNRHSKINGFEQLRGSIAEGAFHNSHERFDPPKCHPETRIAVIEMILSWASNQQRTSSVMWLHGPAGAGKSAIAQTVAEMCQKARKLCATFFFSRYAFKRNTGNHLIATIAHQLIQGIPQLEQPVIDAVEENTALFSLSLQEQIQQLIVKPILSIMKQNVWPENCPQLVIIDGLDECENQDVQKLILTEISETLTTCYVLLLEILEVLSKNNIPLPEIMKVLDKRYIPFPDISEALTKFHTPVPEMLEALTECYIPLPEISEALTKCHIPLPGILEALNKYHIPLCFLVASRPEQAIRQTFNTKRMRDVSVHLALDDRFNPQNDINIFLRSKFMEIRQTHELRSFPLDWPSHGTIETLVNRSSGQFIYASVVMKYLGNRCKSPIKGLKIILGLVPAGNDAPYSLLDQLYSHILSTVDDYWAVSCVLGVLLHFKENYISFGKTKSLEMVDCLLALEHGETSLLLSDLHSIISVPDRDYSSTNLKFHHASFSDFLLDPYRSRYYCIQKEIFNGQLALRLIENRSHANRDHDELRAAAQLYASLNSFHYLSMAIMTPHLLHALSTVDILDVLQCGSSATQQVSFVNPIENSAVLVLQQILQADSPMARAVFDSLQNAMDCHHLNLLSNWASNINQTIYAVLVFIVIADIADDNTECQYLFSWEDLPCPIHLTSFNSKIYRKWVLEYLTVPTRAKEYTMTKGQYKDATSGVFSMLHNDSYKSPDMDLDFALSQVYNKISEGFSISNFQE